MTRSHMSQPTFQRLVLALVLAIVPVLVLLVISATASVQASILVFSTDVTEASEPFTPTGQFESVLSPGSEWGKSIPLVASPNLDDGGIIFASFVDNNHKDSIMRSTDGGRTWESIQMPQSDYQIPLAVSPNFANDHTVFALIENDLYKSTDSGAHWATIGAPETSGAGYNRFIVVSPNYAVDNAIFVGLYDGYGIGGVYSSTNEGQIWGLMTGSAARAVTDFDISPGYPGDPTMFVVSYNDGILRSDDGGTTWVTLVDPELSPDFRVALSPGFPDDSTLFVIANGISNGAIYSSTNRGDSWSKLKESGYFADALAVSPNFSQDQTIIIANEYEGVFMSEDGGATWFLIPELPLIGAYGQEYSLAVAYENGLLLPFASTHQTIYRYRWPSVLAQIFIPLEPGATGLIDKQVSLQPDLEAQTNWTASENTDWLTITPLTGTLPATLTLSIDTAELTSTTSTSLTLSTEWSLNQTETTTVPILVMFVHSRTYLPLVIH